MKKIVQLTGVALAALAVAGSAQAADMKAAPAYTAAPAIFAPSWTGFYVGAGVGLRASRADATSTSEVVDGTTLSVIGAVSQPLDGTAFRVSPYLGFNWQFAPQWIVGIEGDAGFASQTTVLAGLQFSPGIEETGLAADQFALKTIWDAGLRARLGYLLTPSTLAYVTGGAAWQHYEVISTCGGCAIVPNVVTNSTTRTGWTIGGGLETALWGHWLARAEYRYADFGSAPFTIARSGAPGGTPLSEAANFDVIMRTHTVTFGLAYKFN